MFQTANALTLVPTSDVSGIEIERTLRSTGNQNDVSDGSRSGVGRKRKPSDPSDSDSDSDSFFLIYTRT